jgi:universal stress protein A
MKTTADAVSLPPVAAAQASEDVLASDQMAPLSFARILVPIDFSPHCQKALRYAQALAVQFHAELILVHIVEQLVYPGDWVLPVLAMSEFAQETREKLAERLRKLTEAGQTKARQLVRLGRAWQEIVEIAREQTADLIVIGTHGYTGLRHVFMGSVAEKVVRHAPCPVLTVRPDEKDFV